jgi:WD40 repeat protein
MTLPELTPYWSELKTADTSRVQMIRLDSETCLSASQSGLIAIWDLGTGECTQQLCAAPEPVCVQFESNAVMIGSEHVLQLWDARSGECHREIEMTGLTCMQFDHSSIITGHLDGCIRLWDLRTANMTYLCTLNAGAVRALCFDEIHLGCACEAGDGGTLVTMAFAMGLPLHLHSLQCQYAPSSVLLDPISSDTVYFVCTDGSVRQFQIPELK